MSAEPLQVETKLKKKIKLQCLLFLIIGIVLLLTASYAVYAYKTSESTNELANRAQNNLITIRALMLSELNEILSDLQYLSNINEADDAFTSILSEGDLENIVLFARVKRKYDQIRLIDRYGMEAIHIKYNNGSPFAVPNKQLQFKGDRYYSIKSVKLPKNNVYISPFDLSIENGTIERPFKPMLRLSAPLFDDTGKRRGFAMLNYFGAGLLSKLERSSKIRGEDIYLVNEDGYFLAGPHPEDNWGFMFDEKKERTFQAEFPGEWADINNRQTGQLFGKKGLFNFVEVCPENAADSSEIHIENDAGCWKIISFIPEQALAASTGELLKGIITADISLILLWTLTALFICRLRFTNARAQTAMKESTISYERFVPREFLALMEKERYRDITLGSNVHKSMGILFSDIRSYTSISENKSPEEVLAFLNDYFDSINPAIEDNYGFVDSFHGDALLALFPDAPEMAVHAAIDTLRMLEEFNHRIRATGATPIAVGIGVHFGEVTLGTIGTRKRLQATVIGDAVNLASRIESATKTFKINIVITESVYNLLRDPNFFHLREIDTVRVKGKQKPVVLYELYDGDPQDIKDGKAKSAPSMTKALQLYKKGEFQAALDLFGECAEICPEDSIPPIYIKRCNTFLRIPPGKDWSGISSV